MTEELERTIARLERRVERERGKREAAERIAEEGTRRLYDLNVELDGLLAERTDEFERARRALVAADSWKGEFLDSLSHEVRTPLNGILGMMELLSDVVEDETHKLWFDTAIASADRLDRMFTRLLRAIELESTDLSDSLDEVSVASVVDRLVSHWMPRAMRSGHLLVPSVQVEPTFVVQSIEERLVEALNELLSNATVHARPGSVHLDVELCQDRLVFAVIDSGPGLEEERANLLIQPIFQRTSDAWASDGTMGLGLGLARRTADALGATLSLGPSGGGSRGAISVPV